MKCNGNQQPIPRLLNISDVVAITSLSRRTLYAKSNAGSFPKPVKISQRRIAYREADVRAWLNAQPQVQ
jgi:prophage regulatory protein